MFRYPVADAQNELRHVLCEMDHHLPTTPSTFSYLGIGVTLGYSNPCLKLTTRCVTTLIRKGVARRPAQTVLLLDYVEWGCLKHAA